MTLFPKPCSLPRRLQRRLRSHGLRWGWRPRVEAFVPTMARLGLLARRLAIGLGALGFWGVEGIEYVSLGSGV